MKPDPRPPKREPTVLQNVAAASFGLFGLGLLIASFQAPSLLATLAGGGVSFLCFFISRKILADDA